MDAACQYGLGIIRMLAEYQVLEGIPDTQCAQLAARLMTACSAAKDALERMDSPTPPPAVAKSKWRAGHTCQRTQQAECMPRSTVRRAALKVAQAGSCQRTTSEVGVGGYSCCTRK